LRKPFNNIFTHSRAVAAMELKGKLNSRGDLVVMPGIALARKMPQFKARQEFEERMLGAREIQELAKTDAYHTILLNIIFQEDDLHLSDLILAPKKPLASFIKNGIFTFSSPHYEYDGNRIDEERQIIIDERKLRQTGIDLDAEKPFLVIKGSYEIHDENFFSFTITFEKNSDLRPFLLPQPNAGKDGWFGEASLKMVSDFGPVRLNDFLSTAYVGGRFTVARAVLYHDDAQ